MGLDLSKYEKHVEVASAPGQCYECGVKWPCDTSLLLAEVRGVIQSHARLLAALKYVRLLRQSSRDQIRGMRERRDARRAVAEAEALRAE